MKLISTTTPKRGFTVFALVLTFSLGLTQSAQSFPGIRNAWKAQYPTSTTDENVLAGTGTECQICHQSSGGGNGWNAYGWQIRQGIVNGSLSATDAIIAAEPIDSDLDPAAASNLTEINGGTQPGWTPGANNTIYFNNGTTLVSQLPPAISGDLDPQAVPLAGPWGHVFLLLISSALGLVAIRFQSLRIRA